MKNLTSIFKLKTFLTLFFLIFAVGVGLGLDDSVSGMGVLTAMLPVAMSGRQIRQLKQQAEQIALNAKRNLSSYEGLVSSDGGGYYAYEGQIAEEQARNQKSRFITIKFENTDTADQDFYLIPPVEGKVGSDGYPANGTFSGIAPATPGKLKATGVNGSVEYFYEFMQLNPSVLVAMRFDTTKHAEQYATAINVYTRNPFQKDKIPAQTLLFLSLIHI